MANELNLNKKTMSSLEIAELAGKPHNDVLKAIRAMEPAWEKVTQGNFSLSEYKDSTGRTLPCYELNYQECMYIASKFNDETRAKLVLRWDALETGKAEPIAKQPLSPSELILQLAQINVENERKMKELEMKQNQLKAEVEEIKQRTTTDLHQSTIVAYVSRKKINLGVTRYGAMGRKASALCKRKRIEPTSIPDVRWGTVKVFPDEILDEVFANFK